MFQQIKSLLFTQTGKDSTVVFTSTVANIVVGGIFFAVAPPLLGPANYGLFATVMTTGLLIANLANFGIDTGILKFLKQGNDEQNAKILKLAFKSYVVLGIFCAILGILTSGQIANLLGQEQIAPLLKIAFIGTIFTLLSNFFTAALQADKKFKEASIVIITSNTTRLILLVLASYFATLNLFTLTLIFFFVTITSIVVGPIFLSLNFLKAKDEHLHFKNFFTYNFWIAASLAISAIPVDNYLLLKFAGPLATGLFAAPFKIFSTTYQFAGGFSRVLAPRFSGFDTASKAKEFAKKGIAPTLFIFLVILALGLFAPLIELFWGSDYTGSVTVFRILAVGMAFFFADTIPMAIILYYFGKSKIAFFITVWHYTIYTVLLFLLIPVSSQVGAAFAFTISEIVTFITIVFYVIFKFSKNHAS